MLLTTKITETYMKYSIIRQVLLHCLLDPRNVHPVNKKDVTHNFWTKFGDSDCSGARSEPCQGSKRFEAGTVHYCSFPSGRNTKLPDEPGKSITLLPSRCAATFGYTRICPTLQTHSL